MKLITITFLLLVSSLSVQAENKTMSCVGTLYNFTPPIKTSTSSDNYWNDVVFNAPIITIPEFGTYYFFTKKENQKIWLTRDLHKDKKYNWAIFSFDDSKLSVSMKDRYGNEKKQLIAKCSIKTDSKD